MITALARLGFWALMFGATFGAFVMLHDYAMRGS